MADNKDTIHISEIATWDEDTSKLLAEMTKDQRVELSEDGSYWEIFDKDNNKIGFGFGTSNRIGKHGG